MKLEVKKSLNKLKQTIEISSKENFSIPFIDYNHLIQEFYKLRLNRKSSNYDKEEKKESTETLVSKMLDMKDKMNKLGDENKYYKQTVVNLTKAVE